MVRLFFIWGMALGYFILGKQVKGAFQVIIYVLDISLGCTQILIPKYPLNLFDGYLMGVSKHWGHICEMHDNGFNPFCSK